MKNGRAQGAEVVVRGDRSDRSHFRGIFVIALFLLPILVLSGCAGVVTKSGTQSTPGAFQLNPASINFGKVTVGKQTSQSVSVSNTGTVALNIMQATFSNPQFSMSGVTLPMSLAAGNSGSFSVNVNPTAAGNVTGTMTVTGDSSSSPVVVNLSATAVSSTQPQISANPASISFGSVSTGLTGTANLTLSNTGSADLTVSLITLTGSEFSISGLTTPKTISAGQSAQAVVTFAPTAAGSASGNIAITSNDPTTPTLNVALSGTGSSTATGRLSANPTSLSFGTVAVGSNTSGQVVVTNAGNAAVHISAVSTTGTGFSVSGITTPATLNPSQTATLTVLFAPTVAGSATGSVTVTSDASNSPLTIALSGTGAQAGLSVSPATFNFGSVVDGQTKSQSFTLTNSGTASLTITQLAMTGSAYTVSGLNLPATIAAGGTTTLSVLFAPTTAGSLTGSLSITSNAPNSPTTVSLSGTGVAGTVSLTANPTSVSFTGINAGSSSSKSVTITNSGNTSVSVSQVAVNAKDFSASGITTPLTLTAGQTATLNVAFAPSASETITGNITVSTSQGASAVIAVSGVGVQPALTVTPATASFGNVTVGTSGTQTVQLTNSGTGTLSVTQVSVAGTGFSAGTLSLPISLNAGQSTTFNLQFAPTSAGSATGTATIVSNAPNSPATVSLSGTGVAATLVLSLSPTSLSFGNVNTGSSSTQTVTVNNTGNANVQISSISESGTGFTLAGASTPVTLTPNQSLTFSVIFSPASAGSLTGTVTVTSNASGSPATITLAGTGVQATTHTVTLNWTASTSTVAGYNIYRSSTSATSGFAQINTSLVTSLSYVDSGLPGSTTYYYAATAVDASGTESVQSNVATAAIP